MERWIYGIVATAIFATLSGCGASTPDEKQIVEDLQARDNPKFCVTAKSGANREKFIMGGRRVKRLPPC